MTAEPDSMSADQAAAALGVKKATLYTYVSRGMIRAFGDGRARRYARSDVLELRLRADSARGHAAAASSSMEWGAPVLESSVTSIDVDGPNYRGVPALTLAERDVAWERVAELLWTGALPDTSAPFSAPDLGVDPDAFAALVPPDAPVATALGLAVQALGAGDRLRALLTERGELARARILVRRLTALSARVVGRASWTRRAQASLRAPTVAEAVVAAVGAEPSTAPLVNRALVCAADHELNASAFAARVAAGTGADLYGCLAAALATWSGPRHGAASEALEDALELGRGASWRMGDPAPGFGHRLYPGGDPRADLLLRDAQALRSDDPRWGALRELVAQMADAGHAPPNLDLGLVALTTAAGLPPRAAQLLFGLGRTAGWLAHAWEQRASGRILRPRARYVGD